jgi:imidazolonepropionase-like amidohydrolase
MGPWNENYWWAADDYATDEKLLRWMPWRTLIPHARRRALRPETDYSFPILAEAVKDVIAAGGHGAIGAHGQAHGIGPHWEVWMAASAMGPEAALALASREGAHFLGLENDLGALRPGLLADLMVLNANPLDDIRNTADILYVMQGGILYDADTLDEVWPEKRPFGERPWVDEASIRADVRPLDVWDRRH